MVFRNGEHVIVKKIRCELLESSIKVYNLEVANYHTYYVGNSSILTHNLCAMNNLRTLQETVIKGYKVSMDLERGGSWLTNIHLKVGKTKYFYKAGKFVN